MKPSPWMHSEATGRILAKSLSAPRWFDIDGAYSGKISFYAPMVRYRRGVFWQNPFLRPDGLASTGLILTKALSTPRWSGIDRAYFDKISFCAPMA